MNFKDRLLAITDLETTGDVASIHEIIEIGLVLCNPKTFEIVDTLNIKVKPEHPEINIQAAIDVNGYNEQDWSKAVSLKEGMVIYSQKTKDAVFYAYNVTFDWSFIIEAFRKTGTENMMDYHRFDIMSMAFQKFKQEMDSVSLRSVSKILGIPEEPFPHNALNGAMQAFEVLKRL